MLVIPVKTRVENVIFKVLFVTRENVGPHGADFVHCQHHGVIAIGSRRAQVVRTANCILLCFAAEDPDGWLDWRLDEKEQLPINSTAGLVDFKRTVHYRQHTGVSVKINSASGVPGKHMHHVFMTFFDVFLHSQKDLRQVVTILARHVIEYFNHSLCVLFQRVCTRSVSRGCYRVGTPVDWTRRRKAGAEMRSSSLSNTTTTVCRAARTGWTNPP